MNRGIYAPEAGRLLYNPRTRSVTVTVRSFSTGAVFALDDALLAIVAKKAMEECAKRGVEDPCRCGRFVVDERLSDFARGGSAGAVGCWTVRFSGTIQYPDCGTPFETWNAEEALRMVVDVTPKQANVNISQAVTLNATVVDAAGHALAVPLQWSSVKPEIATFPVPTVGTVKGVSAGWTPIFATEECGGAGAAVVSVNADRVFKGSATLTSVYSEPPPPDKPLCEMHFRETQTWVVSLPSRKYSLTVDWSDYQTKLYPQDESYRCGSPRGDVRTVEGVLWYDPVNRVLGTPGWFEGVVNASGEIVQAKTCIGGYKYYPLVCVPIVMIEMK